MPKKKVVVSGFSILMKELQEKAAREGRRIPMDQMKDVASPVWQRMSAEERLKYNQRAKELKGQLRMTTEKLASDGTLIRENFEQLEEEEQRERQMVLDIKEHIDINAEPEIFRANASRQVFYIMAFNILCCTEKDVYIPLEIGIAAYSVQKGILKTYHRFINPGRTPTGYAGEAKRHSEDTHQIPFNGGENSEKDHMRLWEDIVSFFCPGGCDEDLPPVFAPRDGLEQTAGCIQWMRERIHSVTGERKYPPDLRVWDLSYLLNEMRAGVGHPLPSHLIANELLSKNTFDYSLNSRCDFHEDLDSPHCALGVVRRLCYLMSDALCGVFEVEVTDKHLPVRALEEKAYEMHHPTTKKSKDFIENQVLRRIRSSASDTSQSYGLDSFSDDETSSVQSFSDASVYSFRQPAQPPPVHGMAQLRIDAPAVAPGHGIGRGRSRMM